LGPPGAAGILATAGTSLLDYKRVCLLHNLEKRVGYEERIQEIQKKHLRVQVQA
jgi:hypothetical protein